MIRISIKVSNDHRSLTESFEADTLILSQDSEQLQEWAAKVVKDFGDPVQDCVVKTRMEI